LRQPDLVVDFREITKSNQRLMDTLTKLRRELPQDTGDLEFAHIASFFKVRAFRKREIMRMDERMDDGQATVMAFVASGCMKFFTIDENGDEQVMSFVVDHGWFGHINRLPIGRPAVYAKAIDQTELYCISQRGFEDLIHSSAAFAMLSQRLQQQRLMEVVRQLLRWHTLSAEKRYGWLIEESPELMQRVPRQDIASYLGMRPQSLSRLQRRQLIARRRRAAA
jgi:CRP-like cAMP-binding protein